jgi:gamma-glutamylcysteine synthetase
MSNKQQTAVDLIDKKIELYLNWVETKQMSFKEFYKEWDELKKKAKELEKQQIEDAYKKGIEECEECPTKDELEINEYMANQYYKQTYGE